MSAESMDDLVRAIIVTKERKAREHDEIAARALETYKKHVHAATVLRDQVQGLKRDCPDA